MKQARPIRLSNAPGLWLSAGLVETAAGPRSATGTSESVALAEARMHAEAAEAIALAHCKDVPPLHGIAAAAERAAAEQAARCELIERIAAMLWWRGERQAALPSDTAQHVFKAACLAYDHQRAGNIGLLDLSLSDNPPVMLAWSSAPNGSALCFGIAARADTDDATRAATRELCQMEFGLALAQRRRDAGHQLGEADQRILDRAATLTLADCPMQPSTEGGQGITPPEIQTQFLTDKTAPHHVALATLRNPNTALGLTSTGDTTTVHAGVEPLEEPGLTGWPLYL